MPGALFVIASSVDHKLINRLLLHLRDWEYGEEPTWDNFHLITSKDLPDKPSGTQPPITENDLSNNAWKGRSISDVESHILTEWKTESELNPNTFIILDDKGVKDGTLIVLDSIVSDDADDPESDVKRFNKVRVPWEKTYIMWCNLDIANMNFEDFVGDEVPDEANWWTYSDWDAGQETEDLKVIKEKRNNAIAELVKDGMA